MAPEPQCQRCWADDLLGDDGPVAGGWLARLPGIFGGCLRPPLGRAAVGIREHPSLTSGRVCVQAGPSPWRPQTCHVVICPHAVHLRFHGTSAPFVFNQNIPARLLSLASSKNLLSPGFQRPWHSRRFLYLDVPQGAMPLPPDGSPPPGKGRPAVRTSRPAPDTELAQRQALGKCLLNE